MAQKLRFTTTINAPVKKVWETMLDEATYSQWTEAFMPGAGGHYVGKWEKGAKMLFVAPDKDGKQSGMVSEIAEVQPYEFISIHHVGIMENGVEKIGGEMAKKWGDAQENYTFKEENGVTTLQVDMDSDDDFAKIFNDLWPKALAKLKELSEKP